jgi:hypothetical protein
MRNDVGELGDGRWEMWEEIRCEARDRALHEMGTRRKPWLERWTAGAGVDGRGSTVPVGGRGDHGGHTVTGCRHDFTLRSRPARLTDGKAAYLRVSLGLATTPKLTGGHDVARGPGRIDGFALRPARTSQLESLEKKSRGGCDRAVKAAGQVDGGWKAS